MYLAEKVLKLLNRTHILVVPVSFETGEQGAAKVYFPSSVTVTKVRTTVTKALAGTDAGTVTGANATGASTGGQTSHAASAAIGNEQSATPTTNNTVDAGSFYQLTSAKTTAGGKALVTIEYKQR